MYGNGSDYYFDQAKEKEERERERNEVINKLKDFGYLEDKLQKFDTFQLNLIHKRIKELNTQKVVDGWILELNRISFNK